MANEVVDLLLRIYVKIFINENWNLYMGYINK